VQCPPNKKVLSYSLAAPIRLVTSQTELTFAPADVAPSLENLSLSSKKKPTDASAVTKPKKAIADSWDDEDLSGSDTETESGECGATTPPSHQANPIAPPPTPSSPTSPSLLRDSRYNNQAYDDDTIDPWVAALHGSPPQPSLSSDRLKRPEKTDAVAKRLIAGALGVRAPKKTEEQREYDRAIREKEQKRREAERETQRKAKEESERAKAAVWGD
jgi:hypothetical protein